GRSDPSVSGSCLTGGREEIDAVAVPQDLLLLVGTARKQDRSEEQRREKPFHSALPRGKAETKLVRKTVRAVSIPGMQESVKRSAAHNFPGTFPLRLEVRAGYIGPDRLLPRFQEMMPCVVRHPLPPCSLCSCRYP